MGDDGGDEKSRTVPAFGFEDQPVDQMTDHAGDEDDEGVHHPLNQRQCHHVAVGDVGHLVAQHRLGFVAGHAAQQAAADRHQGAVAIHAGGEGVDVRCVVNGDLRHADAGGLRLSAHGFDQPDFGLIARLVDDAGAGHALGRPFGERQRDQGATKTNHRGEHQQRPQVEVHAFRVQDAVDAQQPQDDAQYQNDGQVRDQKKGNTFHDAPPRKLTKITVQDAAGSRR